jgi:hypothetical protein
MTNDETRIIRHSSFVNRAGSAGALIRHSSFVIRAFVSAGSAAALAMVLAAVAPRTADGQFRDAIPRAAYYAAISEFYDGQYRDAERAFRRLSRSGVQSVQARWIDSICYHAMLGEVLYHQGRNAEALGQFDQACLLLLTYPDFLARVEFTEPRPDTNSARRAPPWGASERRFVLGDVPQTMQVLMGDLGAAQRAAQQGGTFLQPQFWRVNIAEIVRASALAIRRRNEILGPLGKYDRISKELSTTLSRRGLVPPNHWSQAWVELLEGLAQAGVGSDGEARTHLDRAVIIGGQLDHPLTGPALLEQGRLALAAGDHRAAARLLAEASFSGFYYEDLDVVTESLRLGWINHLAGGAGGVYPPLDAAATWAQASRLEHVATALRLAQCENLIRLGQSPQAAAIVEEVDRRIGPMRGGRPEIDLLRLQALVNFSRGRFEPGSAALQRALAGQADASLRNFQLVRAGELYDAREVSPRIAVDLYAALVGDPSPSDWAERPLDTLAVLKTPHDDAFDRWFLAALERKDVPLALEIAERAKRARFLATLPLGGRLLALRAILEAPASELPTAAALQRQQLLAGSPEYRELSTAAAQLYQQLRNGPIVSADGISDQKLNDQLGTWQQNTEARERLLLAMALSPLPTTLLFPPLRTTAELQQALAPGEALVVFHVAGGNLFGFVLSRDAEHVWQLDGERQLERKLTELLQSLGNFGRNRELASGELVDKDWRAAAAEFYEMIFAGARFDLAKTTELVIVPDGWLWYVPFEALVAPGGDQATVLADRMPLHYGPTAGLAVGDRRPFRRPQHTVIVATQLAAASDDAGSRQGGSDAIKSLEDAVVGPVQLSPPLAQPGHLLASLVDELIVLDDIELDRNDPYNWSPLARGRGRRPAEPGARDSLTAWMGLPYEGPERIVLTGFPTAAESGLKGSRRGRPAEPGARGASAAGRDVFQAVCGLMAAGGRTVLLTRWRTGGQVNLQLVRELVQELPHASAADAWQRSVLLARETPLDPAAEPRLKRLDEAGEPPRADHPFFWAGYLLVDTGTRPQVDQESKENAGSQNVADNKMDADEQP